MLKHGTLAIALAMGLLAQGARAATLEDNFNDGTLTDWPSPNVNGASLSNPGTNGNPGGYLLAFRDVGNPGHYLSTKYSGDWGAMIGSPGIVVSYDLRVEDTGNIETLRFEISNASFSDIWRRDFFSIFHGEPFPFVDSNDGWVHISYPIDVNWTDEEAMNAGWVRVFESGTPKSFVDVLKNVHGPLTGITHAGNQFVGEGRTMSVGIDNFKIEPAVPTAMPDVNMDGFVNIFDINLVSANWGGSGPDGDANKDGTVNIFDINLISANWDPTAVPVPEPSTIVLLGLAAAGLFGQRSLARRRPPSA